MFCYLYYSVTINESKEKNSLLLFLSVKNIVAPSSSSNFPAKLIC